MCGFVGIVNLNKIQDYKNDTVIRKMNQLIEHRGPDSEGYFINEQIQLGFRRLSILDIEKGAQPMTTNDGRFTISFNGEIYNEDILREELLKDGFVFNTTTDTEVILGMYEKYKDETANKLRGMFSFIIWDNVEKTVYGARDHFGIKPFFFHQDKDTYYFASENKALEAVIEDKKINEEALQHYFTYQYNPSSDALISGIKSILPGTYFKIDGKNKLSFTRYYEPTFAPVLTEEKVLANKITEVLLDSVKAHMRSDVTVGSFLSGGVDSSIIVTLAKQHNPDLKTFSVGFEREGFSEIDVAKETADKLGVKNYSRIITAKDFINEFDDYVWFLDDPLADPAAVAQYFLAQEAVKQCKVSLSGEGADELFGGYAIYHEPLSLAKFEKIPKSVNGMLNKFAKALPEKVKGRGFILRGTTPIEERFIGNAKIFTEPQKQLFMKNYQKNNSYTKVTNPIYQKNSHLDATTRMQDIDTKTWLVGDLLHNADRTTMSSSLELRTPFLDKEVFEVAKTIPTSLKLKNNTTKYILRKAVEGIVPDHVLYRAKLGFPVPIRHWLKDELYDWAKNIIETANTGDLIDSAYALNLLEEHRKGSKDYSRHIWTILTFIRWYDLHFLGLRNK